MKNDTINDKNKQTDEQIVIADECGDSMWDAVLAQEVSTCQITRTGKNMEALLNCIEKVQECDAHEAK